jgi:YVTN family beta-propeller protein
MNKLSIRILTVTFLFVSLFISLVKYAKADPSNDIANFKIYVLNLRTDNVAVVNGAMPQNHSDFNIGDNPVGVVTTPDHKFAYALTAPNIMKVIYTPTDRVAKDIIVGNGLGSLTISPDGRYVYNANQDDDTVTVIDTVTNTTINPPFEVGDYPCGIDITPDGRYLYVANVNSGSVSVIDVTTRHTETITGISYPHEVKVSPDGKKVFVTTIFDGTVVVIDTATNTIIQPAITVGNDPTRMAVTLDSAFLYVTNGGSNSVSVIDINGHQEIKKVENVGTAPDGIKLSPNGAFVYVTNAQSNNVAVIDVSTKEVVDHIPAYGENPVDIAFIPKEGAPDNSSPDPKIILDPAIPDGNNDWYRSPVHLQATASDETGGSGVAELRCVLDPTNPPKTFEEFPAICPFSDSGGSILANGRHTLYAAAIDYAGNKETMISQTFKVDSTQPSITVDQAPGSPDATGWFNSTTGSPVLTFTCSDSGSELALDTCPSAYTFGEGADQSYSTSITDLAGNTSEPVAINDINVDLTAPTLNPTISPSSMVLLNGAATVTPEAIDTISGIASQSCESLDTSTLGTKTLSCSATDKAGNVASTTISYSVISYDFYVVNLATNDVTVIDRSTKGLIKHIEVGKNPVGAAITPEGQSINGKRYVYVPYDPNQLAVIDTSTNKVVKNVEVGRALGYLAISPDGRFVYHANQGDGTVSVVDTATNESIDPPIDVGVLPCGIDITPDGRYLYVANFESDTVSVIDLTGQTTIQPITTFHHPHMVKVTPNGKEVYVTSASDGAVTVIDTTTNQIIVPSIKVGDDPNQMAVTLDSAFVYVVNGASDTVSVIDTHIHKTVGDPIGVGLGPDGIQLSPDGAFFYVTNAQSNDISVINISIKKAIETFNAYGKNPIDIVFIPENFLPPDLTPPTSSIQLDPAAPDGNNGWYRSPVHLQVTASDGENGSGVSEIRCVLDHASQTVTFDDLPATCPFSGNGNWVSTDGSHTLYAASMDYAENTSPVLSQTIHVDQTAPTLNPTITPSATILLNGTATVTPGAIDTISGIASQSCESLDTSTLGAKSLTCAATDNAGNQSTKIISYNVISYDFYVVNLATDDVAVIDRSTKGLITRIEVGDNPVGAAITPEGRSINGKRYVYVPYDPDQLAVIDTSTNDIVNRVQVGRALGYLAISPDGRFVYHANQGDGTVSMVDTTTNHTTLTIQVGLLPCGIDITPDGRYLYVANFNSNNVSVVDLSANPPQTIAWVETINTPHEVKVAPDGKKVFVTSYSDNTVTVIDTVTNKIIEPRIPVGHDPNQMAVTLDSAFLYVVNGASNTVSVIDTQIHDTVGDPIIVGRGPDGIQLSPDGAFIYVTNAQSNDVSIIDIGTNEVVDTFDSFGLNPIDIVFIPENNLPPDRTAPLSVIHSEPADPNGNGGWYRSDVHLQVTASDNTGGSGIAKIRCTFMPYSESNSVTIDDLPDSCDFLNAGKVISLDGIHTIYAASLDWAKNQEEPLVQKIIKIDQTKPTIQVKAKTEDGKPYLAGSWTNQAVTVQFICEDSVSRIASCPSDRVITNGITTVVDGLTVDNAGNSNTISFGPIQINKTNAILQFRDSTGHGIEGGTAQYYDNGWKNIAGSTDSNGQLVANIPVTKGNLNFRMNYAGSSKEKSQDIASNSIVSFQTVNVSVLLRSSTNLPLDMGIVKYYAGSWQDFGVTTNGSSSKELFPSTYTFRIVYSGGSLDKSQDVSVSPIVTFQTVNATVQLKDHAGNPLDKGTVQYYANGWLSFGTTQNGTVSKELLPITYNFRITYGGMSNDLTQSISTNSTIVFQTINATVQLKDHRGNSLDTGTGQYYAGGWQDLGATHNGQVQKELLPGTYSFRMIYAGASNDQTQNIAVSPVVTFETVLVTVQLQNHLGTLIDAGTVQYYSGGWLNFGTTTNGQVNKDLLPGSYNFRMSFAGGSSDKSQNVGTNPTVIFQTGQVYSTSGKCTKYYASGWISFTQGLELLPNTYLFRFSDGTADTQYTVFTGNINNIH